MIKEIDIHWWCAILNLIYTCTYIHIPRVVIYIQGRRYWFVSDGGWLRLCRYNQLKEEATCKQAGWSQWHSTSHIQLSHKQMQIELPFETSNCLGGCTVHYSIDHDVIICGIEESTYMSPYTYTPSLPVASFTISSEENRFTIWGVTVKWCWKLNIENYQLYHYN